MDSTSSKKLAVIFGGDGFVGQHLRNLLSDLNYCVHIADLKCDNTAINEFSFCDVRDEISLQFTVNPHIVFNLAAIHKTPGHLPREYYETNVLGALNITKWCTKNRVRNLVFTSSIAIYGSSIKEKIETSEPNPTSDYGISKLIAESVHLNWESTDTKNSLTIIRPAVIFGVGESGNFTRLARALRLHYFFFPSGKDVIKASGYVKDLVRCMMYASQIQQNQKIFNFSFPKHYSIGEICDVMRKIGHFNKPRSIQIYYIGKFFSRFGGLLHNLGERVLKLSAPTVISSKKILQLGFVWNYDLDAALKDWFNETEFDRYRKLK
jgi:nucleoside-diphosphate-sugar epimerase